MDGIQGPKVPLRYPLAAIASIFFLGCQAVAADEPSMWVVLEPKKFGFSAEDIFSRVDDNKDGKIDEVELRLHKMALFAERDRSKDDNLDKKELGKLRPGVFEKMDSNGDGKISGYEFNQTNVTKLSSMDANKDGTVSPDEFRAYLNAMRKN